MVPFVATLLSHGLGLLANAALVKGKAYIKERTGVDLDKEALSQEDFVALKKYEMEHEEELLRLRLEDDRLSLEERKAVFQDLESARKREAAIVTSPETPPVVALTPSILAIGTVVLTFFFFGLFAVLGKDVGANQTAKEIMLYILGVLSATATQIFSYYFGSSQGSKEKARTIDALLSRKEGEP